MSQRPIRGTSMRNLRRYECTFCEQRLDRVARWGCGGIYGDTKEACAKDGWEKKLKSVAAVRLSGNKEEK